MELIIFINIIHLYFIMEILKVIFDYKIRVLMIRYISVPVSYTHLDVYKRQDILLPVLTDAERVTKGAHTKKQPI